MEGILPPGCLQTLSWVSSLLAFPADFRLFSLKISLSQSLSLSLCLSVSVSVSVSLSLSLSLSLSVYLKLTLAQYKFELYRSTYMQIEVCCFFLLRSTVHDPQLIESRKAEL